MTVSPAITLLVAVIQLCGEVGLARVSETRKAPVAMTAEKSLSQPLHKRIEFFRSQGEQGRQALRKLMFDETRSIETRWRAVTVMGFIAGDSARDDLERALGHEEWFMRNSALLAMTQADPERAAIWARRLMSDKALMVRWAAVDALTELNDKSSAPLLWTKLNAQENFRNGQSLFIRRRIVKALVELDGQGSEPKFMALLKDQDESLHPLAIAALERLTGEIKGGSSETVKAKRERWLGAASTSTVITR